MSTNEEIAAKMGLKRSTQARPFSEFLEREKAKKNQTLKEELNPWKWHPEEPGKMASQLLTGMRSVGAGAIKGLQNLNEKLSPEVDPRLQTPSLGNYNFDSLLGLTEENKEPQLYDISRGATEYLPYALMGGPKRLGQAVSGGAYGAFQQKEPGFLANFLGQNEGGGMRAANTIEDAALAYFLGSQGSPEILNPAKEKALQLAIGKKTLPVAEIERRSALAGETPISFGEIAGAPRLKSIEKTAGNIPLSGRNEIQRKIEQKSEETANTALSAILGGKEKKQVLDEAHQLVPVEKELTRFKKNEEYDISKDLAKMVDFHPEIVGIQDKLRSLPEHIKQNFPQRLNDLINKSLKQEQRGATMIGEVTRKTPFNDQFGFHLRNRPGFNKPERPNYANPEFQGRMTTDPFTNEAIQPQNPLMPKNRALMNNPSQFDQPQRNLVNAPAFQTKKEMLNKEILESIPNPSPLSYSEALEMRRLLNQVGKKLMESTEGSKNDIGREIWQISGAMTDSILNSAEKKGHKQIADTLTKADQYYVENYLPFKEKPIREFTEGKKDVKDLLNTFIKTVEGGTQESPILLRTLVSRISPDKLPVLGEAYLVSSLDKTGRILPDKLAKLYNDLGPESTDLLFSSPKSKEILNNYSEYNRMVQNSRRANPEETPGTLFKDILGIVGGLPARSVTKYLTNPANREALINAIKNSEKKRK